MEKQGVGRGKRPPGIGLLKNRDQGSGIRDQGALGLNEALVESTRRSLTRHTLVPSPHSPVPFSVLRARILICLALILIAFTPMGLWADEEEDEIEEYEPIEVRLEINPANPTVNNPWSIFVLVNHPRPDEVSVESPDFPSSLALERIRTDTRTISSGTSSQGAGSQSERWTRVEFLFIPRRAETIRLAPFEVSIHERYALTDGINIRIQGETSARYEPRFRWLTPPPNLRLGETGEITLELTNWDPARRIPEDFFRGRAPLNAILEENPPERTAAGGYRYRIVLIPLESGSVRLQAFSFTTDTYTLSVPEISFSVLPARQAAAPAGLIMSENDRDDTRNDINPDDMPVDFAAALPFPQEREEVFFLWRREYREIIARVEALWEQYLWADALAEIRKNERDSAAGPSLAPLRREMEEALGLSVTEDERWRPFGFSLFFLLAAVCLVLVFAVAFLVALRVHRHESIRFHDKGGKSVTLRRFYGFIVIIVCTLILALVLILQEGNSGNFPFTNSVRSGKIAVLRRTQSYRVPDYKGAVNDWFNEGQAATVGDFRGRWCFAETLDGRSGWVERESVINY